MQAGQSIARAPEAPAGLNLFLSPREQSRPSHVADPLIATLFGSAGNVAAVGFAAFVCGCLSVARGGGPAGVAVAALEVLVVAARCAVIVSFQRAERAGRVHRHRAWLLRFGCLALASSALWGGLCLIALSSAHDPVLYCIPVISTVGIAGSVAARNSGVPRLAKLQLVLSMAPIALGSLLADDHGFRSLVILVPAMAAGLFILIDERNAGIVALIEARCELERLARLDVVTGIANRRAFDGWLADRRGDGRRFALLMIDVDRFKNFNDAFGHPMGDLLLARVASILTEEVRNRADLVARYGGEEFAILVDGADLRAGAGAAERVRARVEEAFSGAAEGARVTVSIGVAAVDPTCAADELVQRADDALYRAKREGRNRVACIGTTLAERLPAGPAQTPEARLPEAA